MFVIQIVFIVSTNSLSSKVAIKVFFYYYSVILFNPDCLNVCDCRWFMNHLESFVNLDDSWISIVTPEVVLWF